MGQQPRKRLGSRASSTALALVAMACMGTTLAQTNTGDANGTGTGGNPGVPGTPDAVGATGATDNPALPAARTQSANFGISQGFGETDNVFLTPDDKTSQTISTTEVDFGYKRTGSALTANLVGDFDYLDYLQDAYSGQFLGRFDGQSALSLWSDRLKWTLEDSYGETQVDPYTPVTPTNLERTNLLLTGPDLTLRPADQTVVKLGAHYELATYQTSPLNGWRSLEDASIEEDLSPNSSVSLNANTMQLHFDNTDINPDYDNNRYFASYSATGVRTKLILSLGVNQVNDGDSWYTTPYAHLDATRQISPEMSLTLSAGREVTDAANAFGLLGSGAAGGIVVAPVALTMDAYLVNFVSGGWNLQGRRTTVAVTGSYERDTYAIDDFLNVTRANAEMSIGRHLSRVLTVDVSGTWMRTDYYNQDFIDTDYIVGADAAWQAGRNLIVKLTYGHDYRSTTGGIGGYGYSANIGFLSVTWQPLPKQPLLINQLAPNQPLPGQPLPQ
jgi:Putative beta-barrel porin 2